MNDRQQSLPHQSLADLIGALQRGAISRREFLARGTALGIGLSTMGWFVRATQTLGAAPLSQDAIYTPSAVGADGKTRGQDGELKILMWQAVTQLSPHVATGTKDIIGAQLVLEPLMRILPDGSFYPNLLTEVPSLENGGLTEDLTSVTLRLLPDVLWSDGTPFTADDVVFTHSWVTDPTNNAVTTETWSRISEITAIDPLTVEVRFATTNLNWYAAFTGYELGVIYPKHYVEANGGDLMNTAPIGTGPFVVEEFFPNDQIIYRANDNYRFPDKPYFATVNLKGGGDAASAAQAIIQTGDWDYAWNIQLEPEVLASYEGSGEGVYLGRAGTTIERINFNLSDPSVEGPDGQLSWYENPHPILSELAVRQAISLAIDRELILNRLYDPEGERTTANVITGIETFDSPNTSWAFDPEEAGRLLDEAGWVVSGDRRERDGVVLELDLVTTINSVRQKTQAVIQQNLEAVGIVINLVQTDSGIFFDGSPGNEQNLSHMYHDMNMFSSGPLSPTPVDYMLAWYAGPEAGNIAQSANEWNGQNTQRYQNPEYDALWERFQTGEISTLEAAYETLIALNDILVADAVTVPLVNRAAGSGSYAIHSSLIHGEGDEATDNLELSPFEGGLWNVANWNRSTDIGR